MTVLRWSLLAALLAATVSVALLLGGTPLPPERVLHALLDPGTHDDAATIVWTLRLPRVAIAAVVGAALALAGSLMQALLRNPLVDPYLTGVSSGAGATIAVAVTVGVAAPLLAPLGFVSGIASALLVAVLARRGAGIDRERLILAGVSLSALLSAVTTIALMLLARDLAAETLLAWLAGSLAGRGWNDLAATIPELAAGAVLGALCIPALNVLRVGEQRAAALGVRVDRLQWTLLTASTLLTAAAVTLSGFVAFVGLIVPHLARRIVGPDMRAALPAAALCGATLVVAADALARTVAAPAEIPLGVLLAVVGVPTFLVLYIRAGAGTYA